MLAWLTPGQPESEPGVARVAGLRLGMPQPRVEAAMGGPGLLMGNESGTWVQYGNTLLFYDARGLARRIRGIEASVGAFRFSSASTVDDLVSVLGEPSGRTFTNLGWQEWRWPAFHLSVRLLQRSDRLYPIEFVLDRDV